MIYHEHSTTITVKSVKYYPYSIINRITSWMQRKYRVDRWKFDYKESYSPKTGFAITAIYGFEYKYDLEHFKLMLIGKKTKWLL